jgi:hypothetical protein
MQLADESGSGGAMLMKKPSAMGAGGSTVLAAGEGSPVVSLKATCPRGGLVLVGWPMAGEARTKDVLGGQGLPLGTSVSHWDAGKSGYEADMLGAEGEWGTNVVWKRGAGYWIAIPQGGAEASYEISLKGEAATDAEYSIGVGSGENQLGYPYAAEVLWKDTGLAGVALPGDTVRLWDAEAKEYITNVKGEDGAWSDPQMTLKVGEGFWFRSSRLPFESVEKAAK